MNKYVKIFGAGSIGNHLANASVELDYNVILVDNDPAALKRTKNEIYVQRYGAWNNKISLFLSGEEPNFECDLICIGTPPDTHYELLMNSIKYPKSKILVEKPLSGLGFEILKKFSDLTNKDKKRIFVGYNHVVSKASKFLEKIILEDLGDPITLDVEFRENWKGIFKAHPWLSGPGDSYLGNINSGGGSSGEHSHALNLWQHFARLMGKKDVVKVLANYNMVSDEKTKLNYDSLSYFILETSEGFKGSVTQDVVTYPPRKIIKIQGSKLYAEWIINFEKNNDLVRTVNFQNKVNQYVFEKNRPDDFIVELEHILKFNEKDCLSPINLDYGINTMRILNLALTSIS